MFRWVYDLIIIPSSFEDKSLGVNIQLDLSKQTKLGNE